MEYPLGTLRPHHRSRQQKQNYHILFDFRADFPLAHAFFRPLQQYLDPCGGVGVVVRREMQFGDLPEIQTAGQFMPQVVTGMVQGGHGLVLFLLAAAQADLDHGVARVRTYGHVRNIHRAKARIGKLKPDDLGKLLPDCYGNSPGTMLIHKEGCWVLGAGCWQTLQPCAMGRQEPNTQDPEPALHIHSTVAPVSSGPSSAAASSSTDCKTFSACPWSEDTVTAADTDRCHRS